MNKKVLIIMGAVLFLIIATVGVLLYVSSKSGNNQNQNAQTTSQSSTNSTSGSSTNSTGSVPLNTTPQVSLPSVGIDLFSDSQVVSPVFSLDGKSIWYFNTQGRLYKVSVANGVKQEYVLPKQLAVTNVIWPLTGNDFIVDSGASTAPRFHYYDSDNRVFIDYPANIKSVDFMPDGKHVVYVWVSDNKATLSTADYDATNFKNLVKLPNVNDVVKVSPDGKRAFVWNGANNHDQDLLAITLDTKKTTTYKTWDDNGALWSPDGKHFVYHKNVGSSSQLTLGDITSSANDKPLNMSAMLSKMAFDSTGAKIYVALPVDGTNDSVWSVDTVSLEKKAIFANEKLAKVQIRNIAVTADGKTLFFVNSDGMLYSYDIK